MSATGHVAAEFYDRWTELFLCGFGPVLQAGMLETGHPPREDPEGSVLALAQRAGIGDGDVVLDAGCGVAGPAMIIAGHYPNVVIEGVTNSETQAGLAKRRVEEAGFGDRVRVLVGDYQSLPYRTASFDRVIFFESTGYATHVESTWEEAHRVLRPGGTVYVKDVFRRSGRLSSADVGAMDEFDRLWGCVRSKTIVETVTAMTLAGFDIAHAGPMAEMGTARLAGSMVALSGGGLVPSELGAAFLRRNLRPPIEFGEVLAVQRQRPPRR